MRAWVIFRWARRILFACIALLCLAWTTLFAVFLLRESSHFSHVQKIVVVGLLALYSFTAILLYLMIVVHFVYWWDVARVSGLVAIHAGGSMLFMHFSPEFPCRSFSTESTCRNYLHTTLIGCWFFAGIFLCFAITLAIMGFIPQPVEPLQERSVEVPSSPSSSFGMGEYVDVGVDGHTSFYSFNSRTGLVTFQDQGALPDVSDSRPIGRTRQVTFTEPPPHLREKFQNSPILNFTHYNDGTVFKGNTPRGRPTVVPGTQRVKSFQIDPFYDPTSPPTSINSQASMIRTNVGEGTLREPPALVTTQRGRATTQNTLTRYSTHYPSYPTSFGSKSKPNQTFPQTETPPAYSLDSLAAGVRAEPISHAVPPPALTPGVTRFRGPMAFGGPVDPTYDIPFGPWGSKSSHVRVRNMSEPARNMRQLSGKGVRQPTDLRADEGQLPRPRRGSDGQLEQWQRLVLSAAGKS